MNDHKRTYYLFVSVGAIITLAFVATLTFTAGLFMSPQLNPVAQAAPALQTDSEVLDAYEDALSTLYETTIPSVVNIEVTQKFEQPQLGERNSSPFSFPMPDEDFSRRGQGSGFVWDDEGHIVTNFHVIEDAEKVTVVFVDDTRVEAEIIGEDPDSDLAVLKVDLPASQLAPLAIGDSDALKVGQITVALGNPFGQDFTMTSGIVSAVGRTIRSGNSNYSIPEAIQTDASINPGNSGGPLLNRYGEVIGINSQIISRSGSSSGIGFAIPVNIAKQVIPTLIEGKAYEYAWLGISGQTLTDSLAEVMDLPADTKGALVISIADDGPADNAGLRGSDKTQLIDGFEFPVGGDVVTAIEGSPISDMDDLITYLVEETRPGDEVTLDIIRDGDEESLTVSLGTRPNN